jgi:hypothetical protein
MVYLNGEFRLSLPKRRGKKTAGINESRFPTCLSRSQRLLVLLVIAGGPVTFDDDVNVVADSSATFVPAPDILETSGHATIVVDEMEKKRRDSDSIVTDEIYLFRNLVHEIHKMCMFTY